MKIIFTESASSGLNKYPEAGFEKEFITYIVRISNILKIKSAYKILFKCPYYAMQSLVRKAFITGRQG